MDLIDLRRTLHSEPELSKKEFRTAKRLKNILADIGVDNIYEDFNLPSFIAEIKGNKDGTNTTFRCELDALPINEKNDFEHKSVEKNISHKCGHDGHMTIMIGLAKKIVENRPEKGNVYLLFQSAEETGHGAADVVKSQVLSKLNIDQVFALHNVPGFEKGQIVLKSGMFTPHVESFTIKLSGKNSHAGEPDNAISPLPFIQEFSKFMDKLHHPESNSKDYFVVSPVFIAMGERSFGTTAGYGEIGYTIRTKTTQKFEEKRKIIKKRIEELANAKKLEFDVDWTDKFYSNFNNAELTDVLRKASNNLNLDIIEKPEPFDWGEDFGLITQVKRGGMFGLGAGKETPPLHDNYYDFPDEITPYGVNLFFETVKLIHQ